MSMDDYTNDRGISTGAALIVGAAIGAGIALLYAPRSGRETRHSSRREHRACATGRTTPTAQFRREPARPRIVRGTSPTTCRARESTSSIALAMPIARHAATSSRP